MRPLYQQTFGAFDFHVEGTEDALYANGVKLKLDHGGPAAAIFDGRYICVLLMLNQGKTYWYSDVVFAAFDTQTNQWQTYTHDLYDVVGVGLQPHLIWLKSRPGSQDDQINRVRFNGVVPEWDSVWSTVTERRTVDPATGNLGAIQ